MSLVFYFIRCRYMCADNSEAGEGGNMLNLHYNGSSQLFQCSKQSGPTVTNLIIDSQPHLSQSRFIIELISC